MPFTALRTAHSLRRAEMTEMDPLIKHASNEGNTKHGDLEQDGNDHGFVAVVQAVDTTVEGVRANDPSLNQRNDGSNAFVTATLILICLLLLGSIVQQCLNPEQAFLIGLNTLNLVNILLLCIRLAQWATDKDQAMTSRDMVT
jgi:hypothetical protein